MFTQKWLALLVPRDLFQWIFFNLPTLPDKRRVATSYLDIPVDFYLPDRKNSRISKIVSRQSFDRQTPDGNEGFVIEIQYLRRAFGTKNIFN